MVWGWPEGVMMLGIEGQRGENWDIIKYNFKCFMCYKIKILMTMYALKLF